MLYRAIQLSSLKIHVASNIQRFCNVFYVYYALLIQYTLVHFIFDGGEKWQKCSSYTVIPIVSTTNTVRFFFCQNKQLKSVQMLCIVCVTQSSLNIFRLLLFFSFKRAYEHMVSISTYFCVCPFSLSFSAVFICCCLLLENCITLLLVLETANKKYGYTTLVHGCLHGKNDDKTAHMEPPYYSISFHLSLL